MQVLARTERSASLVFRCTLGWRGYYVMLCSVHSALCFLWGIHLRVGYDAMDAGIMMQRCLLDRIRVGE